MKLYCFNRILICTTMIRPLVHLHFLTRPQT
nr:MAG TPA: hypothetical protein [Podoviridae sp. ctY3D12]